MKNFPLITKTSRTRNEDLFVDLFRCVVLGHVAVPEVHHCNLLAITEKIQTYIHVQYMHKWSEFYPAAMYNTWFTIECVRFDWQRQTYTNNLLSWSRNPVLKTLSNCFLFVGMFLKHIEKDMNRHQTIFWFSYKMYFWLKLLGLVSSALQYSHLPLPKLILNVSVIKDVPLTLFHQEHDQCSVMTTATFVKHSILPKTFGYSE